MTGARLTRRSIAQARLAAFAHAGAKARVQLAVVEPAAAETEDAPAAGAIAELWLYGVVGGWWWGFDAETVAGELRRMPEDVAEVRVRVHSPGGNAVDGVAIGNLFRNHPARFVGVNDGLAASAASVLILGCDDIVMSPGSQIMIHDASTLTYGNAAQLRADADWIDKQSQNYAGVYATRGGTPEAWREAMTADAGRGTWYTAAEAVAAGLADREGTVQSVSPPPPEPTPEELDLDDTEMEARAAYDRDVLCHPDAWAAWSSNAGARPAPPKPPTASADGITTPKGSSVMKLSDAAVNTLKAKLGVTAEDADEATLLGALDEVLAEQTTPTTPQAPTPTMSTPPAGTVLVDAETWASVQAQAADGATARTEQLNSHRDTVIQAAIDEGKFAAGRREHFEASWKADAAGTEETIKALQPGLVPVTELGHDTPTGAQPDALDDTQADAIGGIFGLTAEELKI